MEPILGNTRPHPHCPLLPGEKGVIFIAPPSWGRGWGEVKKTYFWKNNLNEIT
jgi:hypothetical protein